VKKVLICGPRTFEVWYRLPQFPGVRTLGSMVAPTSQYANTRRIPAERPPALAVFQVNHRNKSDIPARTRVHAPPGSGPWQWLSTVRLVSLTGVWGNNRLWAPVSPMARRQPRPQERQINASAHASTGSVTIGIRARASRTSPIPGNRSLGSLASIRMTICASRSGISGESSC
jgi:hypothetical protein